MKALRSLLVTLVLSLFCLTACASPTTKARAVVHKMTSATTSASCSAVAIAPGQALTAAHCLAIPDPRVNDLPVTGSTQHLVEDLAVLTVPGLQCPCAAVSPRRPALDEEVFAVGYLYGEFKILARGGYFGRVTSPEGQHFGHAGLVAGPGTSGGGVFMAYVTGEVLLVGVITGMTPLGTPTFYVEVSQDAKP